jgi:hypothetical protein
MGLQTEMHPMVDMSNFLCKTIHEKRSNVQRTNISSSQGVKTIQNWALAFSLMGSIIAVLLSLIKAIPVQAWIGP